MKKNERIKELEMIAEHEFSHRFNHTLHAYIDIAGDIVSGTLLSQIMYWFTPNANGERKVKVLKDGHYWIAKKQEDWYHEIRITEKQYRTAIKKLEEKNLVIKKRYKFNGSPTTHIRPNYPVLQEEIEKWKHAIMKKISADDPILTKGQKPVKSSISEDKQTSKPAELLDFDQRAKSNLTKGQNRNLQLGKNLNRDYNKEYNNNERDVVVSHYQQEFKKLFNEELAEKDAESFALEAEKNGKDLMDYIHYVKGQSEKRKIGNLVGYLRDAVYENWDVPSVAELEQAAAKEAEEREARKKENDDRVIQALIAAGINPAEVGY